MAFKFDNNDNKFILGTAFFILDRYVNLNKDTILKTFPGMPGLYIIDSDEYDNCSYIKLYVSKSIDGAINAFCDSNCHNNSKRPLYLYTIHNVMCNIDNPNTCNNPGFDILYQLLNIEITCNTSINIVANVYVEGFIDTAPNNNVHTLKDGTLLSITTDADKAETLTEVNVRWYRIIPISKYSHDSKGCLEYVPFDDDVIIGDN